MLKDTSAGSSSRCLVVVLTVISMYSLKYPAGDHGKSYKERMEALTGDTVAILHKALDMNKRVLLEGANATMLDIDFGTYPFVTSSNPSIGGMLTGLGLPPNKLEAIIGVVGPI